MRMLTPAAELAREKYALSQRQRRVLRGAPLLSRHCADLHQTDRRECLPFKGVHIN